MSNLVDAIGSAVSWVGEAVADVADFVVDDILMPVIDTVGGVVKGMLADPFTTIATLAAAFTPGMQWAIPIIQGASVAAKGGSFGDIALAVAASYAGGKASAYVGDAAGSYAYDAVSGTGASFATQAAIETAATEIASSATRGALTAAITGNGNILDAGLSGALSGAGSAVFQYASSQFDFSGDADTIDTDIINQEDWDNASASLSSELNTLVTSFKELPQVAQDMIVSGATASVTSLITTGELNPDLVAGAIAKAGITTGLIKDALTGGVLDDKQAAIATKVIGDVVNAAYSGTDGYATYQASITQVGMGALNQEINKLLEDGGLNNLIERITNNSDEVNITAQTMEAGRTRAETFQKVYETKFEDLRTLQNKLQEDIETYNSTARFGDKTAADVLLNSINEQKEEFKILSEAFKTSQKDAEDSYTYYLETVESYKNAGQNLLGDQADLDVMAQPVTNLVSELVAKELDPSFNAEEYREINNISAEEDPYVHWLENGRKNITNQDVYDQRVDTTIREQVADIVMANFDTKLNTTEDLEALYAAVKESVGTDLSVFQTSEGMQSVRQAAEEHLNGIETREILEGSTTPITRSEGVTDADIINNKAVATVVEGNDGALNLKYVTEITSAEVFDPRVNQKVTSVRDLVGGKTTVFSANVETLGNALSYLWDNVPFGISSANAAETDSKFSTQITPDITKYPREAILEKINDNNNIEGFENYDPSTLRVENGNWIADTVSGTSFYFGKVIEPSLKELKETAPLLVIDTAGNLDISAEAYKELDWATRQLFDFSKNVKKAADNYAASTAAGNHPDGAAYAVKLAAGVALDVGGQTLNAFNGIVTLFNDNEDKPIDSRETNLGKVTQAMMDLAKATQPDEYNAAIEKFNSSVKNATGFAETASAIFGGIAESPFEVLIEIVGKEVIPEVALFMASGGVGNIAGGALGVIGASAVLAQKFGTAAAWGTNAGLQILETAGSIAGETYADLYDEAIKMGVDPLIAAHNAQQGALLNSLEGAIIEGIAGRIIDPGDILAKKIAGAGDKLFGETLEEIAARGSAAIAAEAVSEGLEEGWTQYRKIKMVEQINPAVTQEGGRYHDVVGETTTATILGAIAGGGVVTTLGLGNAVPDGVDFNYYNPSTSSPAPDSAGTDNLPVSVDTGNPVANVLKYFNPSVIKAVDNAQSADPEVRTQGETVIKDAFGYDSFFGDDGSIIDLTKNPNGVATYNTAVDILNIANDNEYTSYREVQDAYKDIAEQSPYTLTDQELLEFTGDGDDVDVGKRVTDTVNRGYVDQLFSEEGYTPTPEEISTALAQADEGVFGQDLGTALTTQFDPLAVSEQEVRDYYGDQGYTGSFRPSDLDLLTGNYAESELAEKADKQLPIIAYNSIADLIGKSGQDVTDTDIDFVTDLIAQRKVMTEPTPYTKKQLQYDVTGDNVIDIADQNVLQNMLTSQQTGQQVGPATAINTATQFASTGITGELERMRQQQQRNTQQQNIQQLYGQLNAKTMNKVVTPDAGEIKYTYNPFGESIFATPEQEGLFVDPYSSRSNTLPNKYKRAAASGGLIQDRTDEIMKILGGPK